MHISPGNPEEEWYTRHPRFRFGPLQACAEDSLHLMKYLYKWRKNYGKL